MSARFSFARACAGLRQAQAGASQLAAQKERGATLSLSKGALALCLLAVSACASLPQVIPTGTDSFDVRYDNLKTSPDQADAAAHTRCPTAQLVSGNVRSDGLSYRTYRCVQPASGS